MKKSEIKKMAVRCIDLLEYGAGTKWSILTCFEMPFDYGEFLTREKILADRFTQIRYEYFFYETDIEANLFRMMCVTEYCRQKGVEL